MGLLLFMDLKQKVDVKEQDGAQLQGVGLLVGLLHRPDHSANVSPASAPLGKAYQALPLPWSYYSEGAELTAQVEPHGPSS